MGKNKLIILIPIGIGIILIGFGVLFNITRDKSANNQILGSNENLSSSLITSDSKENSNNELLNSAYKNSSILQKGIDSINTSNELQLWYLKPASEGQTILKGDPFYKGTQDNNIWQQLSLPIGNGYMGANVFGEIASERLSFNEKTLWNGGPSNSRPNYAGGNLADKGKFGTSLKQIQNLFLQGKSSEATASAKANLIGANDGGYAAYQGWGEIFLNFGFDKSKATNYIRDLNLDAGIASVNFDYNGTHYRREFFISYPDNVMVIRLTSSNGGKQNFSVDLNGRNSADTIIGDNTITLKGELSDNQLKFNSKLKVTTANGVIKQNGFNISVTDSNCVVIYVAASTDYKNEYPLYRTGQTAAQLDEQVKKRVENAAVKGFDRILSDHLKDYQSIFGRLKLNLGQQKPGIPTDELLEKYKSNAVNEAGKRYLEVLLYQYGRYLMIGSSRIGSLPANLQGVWNDRAGAANYVPWGSDYHMNINLQMNYWPVYSANMAECSVPLIDYVDSLRKPGRVTAEIYAGIKSGQGEENGFTAHTQNTPFGYTAPGWNFSWGWSPAAVPWILQNCWENYEYTMDLNYLKNKIYPMMKESAKFYDQTLVRNSDNMLISCPAFSPEYGPITDSNTYEQTLIWQLYEDTIKAAGLVGEDSSLISKWKKNKDDLKGPIEIGSSGQIKEWYFETALRSVPNAEPQHRHLSHLLGLYPGDLISVETPNLLNAAIVSMVDRGDNATGWGIGQRINTWARTGDGNHCFKLIGKLFETGIYPNLFDTHPPFQIDGNFGLTSGVSEMLVQSNLGYINILPALPDAWSTGNVSGIIARGNFELSISWSNKIAKTITVKSKAGGNCIVQSKNIQKAKVTNSKGNAVSYQAIKNDRISFETIKGETYTIS